MAKPAPKRISSDGCAVNVDGTTCYPHEGEWVELYRMQTVGELRALEGLRRMGVQIQSVQGDSDEADRTLKIVNANFAEVCGFLAGRVTAWDWTDLAGNPLPQPGGNLDALAMLTVDELMWLISAGQAETVAERKNGLAPSPITSSATESVETGAQKSTMGRNRGKPSSA